MSEKTGEGESVPKQVTGAIWNLGQEAKRGAGALSKRSVQFVVNQTLDRVMGFKFGDEHTRPSEEHGIITMAEGYLELEAATTHGGQYDEAARERLVVGALLLLHGLGVDFKTAEIEDHVLPVERVHLAAQQAKTFLGKNILE
jgi:hypothetical protein